MVLILRYRIQDGLSLYQILSLSDQVVEEPFNLLKVFWSNKIKYYSTSHFTRSTKVVVHLVTETRTHYEPVTDLDKDGGFIESNQRSLVNWDKIILLQTSMEEITLIIIVRKVF